MSRTPNSRKEETHERIVAVAARAIRERGYAGVGVADVMKEAGLTHGGFYAHFDSRDALLVEALERAGRDSAEAVALAAERRARRGVSAFRSLVETYLAARGIKLPMPDALRFHGDLRHPTGDWWPGMVALVTNGVDATPLAIHRTFLARDGSSKAPVDSQKMMLGPCRGGVVRLGDLRGAGAADAADADPSGRPPANSDVLMVGEGIETCLAAMQATGHPTWAALSTTGLKALDLPENVRDVIVLADGDAPGEAAARDCSWRWKRQGRRVRIARPPQGTDFNDMLMVGAGQ